MGPDQTTLISGEKGQVFTPTASICTTAFMNCKPQEAPEAVFLSSFFFVGFFLSFQFLFPAIVQVETQIVCFACLSVSDCRPVGKENETKEQIQALSQTPI